MLKEIARSGDGSFLSILKTFGNRQPVGMLGFPRPGVTLALDFPNHGERTHKLFEQLEYVQRNLNSRRWGARPPREPSTKLLRDVAGIVQITAAMLYDLVQCPHRPSMDLFGDPAKRDEINAFVQLLWEKGTATSTPSLEV